jgi:hypothetical protein
MKRQSTKRKEREKGIEKEKEEQDVIPSKVPDKKDSLNNSRTAKKKWTEILDITKKEVYSWVQMGTYASWNTR